VPSTLSRFLLKLGSAEMRRPFWMRQHECHS
jgi:hypothetical protein